MSSITLDIEAKELRKPRSFTLKPSTLALIEEYADMKGSNSSRVVETLITHFLPRIIKEEKSNAAL